MSTTYDNGYINSTRLIQVCTENNKKLQLFKHFTFEYVKTYKYESTCTEWGIVFHTRGSAQKKRIKV